jgi:DNA-binding transcriptional LysR family regulator
VDATIDLSRISYFVTVAELASFSATGRKLGVPTSTVSRAVAGLEDELGLRLFQRTTRHVSLTVDGAALYEKLAPAWHAVSSALATAPERDQPAGALRVTAPPDIGAIFLARAIPRFTARHPLVSVEVWLTSRAVDIVREGFDFAIRAAAQPLKDSSLVARALTPLQIHLYASPSYLARCGTPRSASDLARHELVAFRGWKHERQLASVIRAARVVCDDFLFARAALVGGAGIGFLPPFVARDEVGAGTLVQVLPKVSQQGGARLFLIHANMKQVPKRLSAFRDFCVEMFAAMGGGY